MGNYSDEILNVTLNWGNSNNNGNLLGATYNNGGPGYPVFLTFTQAFGYDNLNRLTSATDNGGTSTTTGGWSRGFHCDAFGNMWVDPTYTGQQLNPNTTITDNYSSNNRRTDQSYDPAGNLNSIQPSIGLTYDAENRQIAAGAYSYLYDGNGRRVEKIGGGITTVFAYDTTDALAAEYSTTPNTSPCATCYLSYDHLGTVRLITDSNHSVVSRHDYLPFGEEIPANTSGRDSHWGPFNDTVNEKFTGKERDVESGLDYFGARYYGSALGRFTSADPIWVTKERLLDPQRLNLYAYGRNNPLSSWS